MTKQEIVGPQQPSVNRKWKESFKDLFHSSLNLTGDVLVGTVHTANAIVTDVNQSELHIYEGVKDVAKELWNTPHDIVKDTALEVGKTAEEAQQLADKYGTAGGIVRAGKRAIVVSSAWVIAD